METFKYSELLDGLEGFDAWLISLGLTPRPNDRVHEAFKVLQRAEEASRQGRETGNYAYIRPGDWFLIVEALEAHHVFTAFRNDTSPVIAETLKRSLSGPLHPIHENSRNRDGRNIWFELALAAEWRLRGASVITDEPDLHLTRDDITFLIACKRPASEHSVDANIRDAISQLQRSLEGAPPSSFGVAAISLNCVFNPGNMIFSGEMNALNMLLQTEFAKREQYFLSMNDPKICCVMFHVTTPGIEEGVDLIIMSQTLAWDLNRPSIGSMVFREHAQEMLGNPRHFPGSFEGGVSTKSP